jgi:RNA polymerase sigma-70 factor, ECF subfamily
MQFDTLLIERLLQHDDLAFATFYEQTVDVFFRYVMTHYSLSEAECHDILSDVYLKIWDNVGKYNETYTFWQFVRTILKNHCKDYFKKTKPLFFSDLEDIHGNSIMDTHATLLMGKEEKDMESFFDEQFSFEYIQEALSLLDPQEQEIFHAKYVLNYSYDIISDIYDIKSETIRQKMSRILKKLKKTLHFLKI